MKYYLKNFLSHWIVFPCSSPSSCEDHSIHQIQLLHLLQKCLIPVEIWFQFYFLFLQYNIWERNSISVDYYSDYIKPVLY